MAKNIIVDKSEGYDSYGSIHDNNEFTNPNPITLTWENVNYSVEIKKGLFKKGDSKQILHDLSGIIRPGQLLAIMGSTGAGKSSLLDVLAMRKEKHAVTGTIKVNGKSPNKYFKRLSAYVTQDDCLQGLLTVKETLQFYADLKLPPSVSRAEKRERVDKLLKELGLYTIRDSRVGTQFRRGISGGEKKRLSIGCQLITDPGILFLDEPTTGLDAYNSLSVLEHLNLLCKKGLTIICTIHQPRSTIFDLFDQLMILSQGRLVYSGAARQAVSYFSRLNFMCGQFINPADYFIDVTVLNERALIAENNASISQPLISESPDQSVVNLAEQFKHSELKSNIEKNIIEVNAYYKENPVPKRKMSEYANNWFMQTFTLSKRILTTFSRNPLITYAQLGQTLFMALLVGTIYFQIGDDQGSIQDRVGALFFMMTNQAFGMFASLNILLEERDMFNRERAGGCYTTSAYFFGKVVVESPVFLIYPFIFSCISYWMVGLQPYFVCFGVFVLGMVVFSAVASSTFMTIGAASPNAIVAQIFAPVVTVLFMLFGGFYVNADNIPVYYGWLYYISFFRYGFSILTYNEFNGMSTPSHDRVLQFECLSSPCISNGNEELNNLGLGDMTNDTVWIYFGVLIGMFVVYRFISYLCLRFLYKRNN